MDGRRAGHGLPRAVARRRAPVGEAEPDDRGDGGGGAAGRGGGAVGGPGGADAGQGRHRAALVRETQARTALAEANTKVQARYELALEAIKTFHTGVSEDFLLKQDQFKELRDRLLRSASDFYGKLSALLGKETDVASRRALADSNFELAELTDKVGDKEAALAAHRAVLAAREALAAEPGADAESEGRRRPEPDRPGGAAPRRRARRTRPWRPAGGRSRCWRAWRVPTRRRGLRWPTAGRSWAPSCRARATPPRRWRPTSRRGPTRRSWPPPPGPRPRPAATWRTRSNGIAVLLSDTGESCGGGGRVPHRAGDPAKARRRQSRRHRIPQRPGNQPQRSRQTFCFDGQAVGGGGRVPHGGGDPAEAGRRQSRRHRIPQQPGDQPQQSRRRAGEDGQAVGGGGRVPHGAGDPAEAGRRQPRRHRIPHAAWRSATTTSAICCSGTGKPAEAEAEFRTAVAILQKLADDNPAVTEFRSYLALSHNNLGTLLSETGKPSGGGGRVPQGGGDPAEAGRRQPRRHRIPLASWQAARTISVYCSPDRSDSPRHSPLWRPVWPFVRSWSTPIPRTPVTQIILAIVTPTVAGPRSLPGNPPWPPPTCAGLAKSGPSCRNRTLRRDSSRPACWRCWPGWARTRSRA